MVGTSSSSVFVVLMVLQSLHSFILLLNVSQNATISCREVSAVFQIAPFAASRKLLLVGRRILSTLSMNPSFGLSNFILRSLYTTASLERGKSFTATFTRYLNKKDGVDVADGKELSALALQARAKLGNSLRYQNTSGFC